jgi:hypothetical protein
MACLDPGPVLLLAAVCVAVGISVRVLRLACAHLRGTNGFKVRRAYLHSDVARKAPRAHIV